MTKQTAEAKTKTSKKQSTSKPVTEAVFLPLQLGEIGSPLASDRRLVTLLDPEQRYTVAQAKAFIQQIKTREVQ